MKAIIPEVEQYKLYDKTIAKDVEAIAELGRLNEKEGTTCVGMYYDGSIDTDYVFQMMKIFNSCVKGSVTIYIDTNKKSFKALKQQNTSLNLKKINLFNKTDVLYVVRPGYLKALHKDYFSKERFYTENLMEEIWNAYYRPKTEEEIADELSDLL